MKWFVRLMSFLAFVFSVISLVINYTSWEMPTIDTGSFLVAVLAVLVTVLIGFQIINYFQFESKLDEKIKESEDRNREEVNSYFFSMAYELYNQFVVMSRNSTINERIMHLLGAIFYGNLISDEDLNSNEGLRNSLFFHDNILNILCDSDEIENMPIETRNAILSKTEEMLEIKPIPVLNKLRNRLRNTLEETTS